MATTIAGLKHKMIRTKAMHFLWAKQIRLAASVVMVVSGHRFFTVATETNDDGINFASYFQGRCAYAMVGFLTSIFLAWYCLEPCRDFQHVSYLVTGTGTMLQVFIFARLHRHGFRKGDSSIADDFPIVAGYHVLVTVAVMFMQSQVEKMNEHLENFESLEQQLLNARRQNGELKKIVTELKEPKKSK